MEAAGPVGAVSCGACCLSCGDNLVKDSRDFNGRINIGKSDILSFFSTAAQQMQRIIMKVVKFCIMQLR